MSPSIPAHVSFLQAERPFLLRLPVFPPQPQDLTLSQLVWSGENIWFSEDFECWINLCITHGPFLLRQPPLLDIVKAVPVNHGECDYHNSSVWCSKIAKMVVIVMAGCVDTPSNVIKLFSSPSPDPKSKDPIGIGAPWHKKHQPDSAGFSIMINVSIKTIQDCGIVLLCKFVIIYSLKETCFSDATVTNHH